MAIKILSTINKNNLDSICGNMVKKDLLDFYTVIPRIDEDVISRPLRMKT